VSGLVGIWPPAEALLAWWRTRRLARRLRSRADVERWQRRQVARLLQHVLPKTSFYSGMPHQDFSDLPIIDKSVLMAQFENFNQPRLTASEGWRALAAGGRHGHYFVGASTGTSGNRGLYIISEAERWRWLGTILAKTLPRLSRARVALILPLDTSLYDAAGRSFLDFRFFDLKLGLEACAAGVGAFDPNIIIAPPKVLRVLAEADAVFSHLSAVFSVAEVLDPLDRIAIEARFGLTIREIYMATEGLLGVACERGTLHLSEDTMLFEFEETVAGSGLVSPIITDFSRQTQAMVRYRMNDLLRLSETPCPCGSPLRAVAQIEGRLDDLLLLPTGNGRVQVTPDILRNAIVSADVRIEDFRLIQTGEDAVTLNLFDVLPEEAVIAACTALAKLFEALGIKAAIEVKALPELEVTARKLRRVERRWQP
jgi:putative adenylate-forming enzyme